MPAAEFHTVDQVIAAYEALDKQDQSFALHWLRENFQHSKTLCRVGTYSLKHYLERINGPYMHDEAFKGMLLAEGYRAANIEPNVSSNFYLKPKASRWEQIPGHPYHDRYLAKQNAKRVKFPSFT